MDKIVLNFFFLTVGLFAIANVNGQTAEYLNYYYNQRQIPNNLVNKKLNNNGKIIFNDNVKPLPLLSTIRQPEISYNNLNINKQIKFIEQNELVVGDHCVRSYDGSNGECALFSNCPIVIQDYRENGIRPEICSYSGSNPIVCCPRDFSLLEPVKEEEPEAITETLPNEPNESNDAKIDQRFPQKLRISVEKCEEYSQLTKKTVPYVPLVINPTVHEFSISKCDYKTPLIVGGEKTQVAEFPHMAVIGYKKFDGTNAWRCGGSLISDEFILTAAHCLTSELPEVVRLGEQNLVDPEDGAQPEDYGITDIVVHPDYKKSSNYNDIALIRLSRKVNFNKYIRPACLWQTQNVNYTSTVATGWGRVDYAGETSDDLLKVVLNIYDNQVCNDYFQKTRKLKNGIINSQLCAGYLEGGKDTCQGDSGGPIQLTTPGNECMFHIIGITSFGKYCALANGAGVYTRVSSFIDWIESVVWCRQYFIVSSN